MIESCRHCAHNIYLDLLAVGADDDEELMGGALAAE